MTEITLMRAGATSHRFRVQSWAMALIVAGSLALGATQALAQGPDTTGRTFVPSGHLYGPNSERLPHPDSRRGRVNAETDIYETEIYREQVRQREFQERLRQFNTQEDQHLGLPGQ